MDVNEALSVLLEWPPGPSEEEMEHAMVDALKESQRRRVQNSAAGGAVIKALLDRGWSYTRIEDECGIPRSTAHRWANPPEES